MKKKRNKIPGMIPVGILLGAFLVQIILAFIWAWNNFFTVQEFYETNLYFSSVLERQGDGWNLRGYPLLLEAMQALFHFSWIRYYVVIYILQVVFSWICFSGSVMSFVKIFMHRQMSPFYALLLGAYVLTIPVVWQMQFALLPDALCLAAVCVLFSRGLELVYDPGSFHWDFLYVMAGTLILTGLFERHYFYGAAIWCVIIYLHYILKRRAGLREVEEIERERKKVTDGVNIVELYKKRTRGPVRKTLIFYPMVCVLVCIVVIAFLHAERMGVENRYNIVADFMNRAVLPYAENTERFYDEELQVCVAEPETALALCKEAFELHGSDIVLRLAKEGAGHVFAPFSIVKYMHQGGNSKFGYNYSRMWEDTPVLTRNYFYVGNHGALMVVLAGLVTGIVTCIKNKELRCRFAKLLLLPIAAILVITFARVIFSTISIDYRDSLFAQCIWVITAVTMIVPCINFKKD